MDREGWWGGCARKRGLMPITKERIGCSRSEGGKLFSIRDGQAMARGGQKSPRAEEESVCGGAVWMREAMAMSGTVPGGRSCGTDDDRDQHQGALAAMRADQRGRFYGFEGQNRFR